MTVGFFFFQAEDGIRDGHVTGVQTCALPISRARRGCPEPRRPSRGGPVAVRGRSPASARYGRWCLHRPGGYSSSHFLLLRANTANEDRRRPLWTAMAASAPGSLRANDSSTPTASREAMIDEPP